MEIKTINEFDIANGVIDDIEIDENLIEQQTKISQKDTYLVFIEKVGQEQSTEHNIYNFMFSVTPDIVWGESWSEVPASLCPNLTPEISTYQIIKILKTPITFKLATKNSCCSMQDCIDKIIALGYEDISEYDEYPDDRLVFHFGEKYQDVDNKLGKRHNFFADKDIYL